MDRHGGDHEDDGHVHEGQPAEAAGERGLEHARLLEAHDRRDREDAQGGGGHEQPPVEKERGHQDDHRVHERRPVVDALPDHEHRVNGAEERAEEDEGGGPRAPAAQQPERDEAEAAQGDQGHRVPRLSAQEVGGGAERRSREPRMEAHPKVGRDASLLRRSPRRVHRDRSIPDRRLLEGRAGPD